MAVEDDILAFIKQNGPILPVDVARHIKTNIIFASAYLSELSSRGKVRISSLKVGGSPVYYIAEQHDKLDKFASNLNEKDLRAYELLKQKRVLRDTHMTPLMRVALRSIKDFAAPVTVTFENKQELFWKWYNSTDEEVKKVVQEELGIPEKVEEKAPEVPAKPEETTQKPKKVRKKEPQKEEKLNAEEKKIEQEPEKIEKFETRKPEIKVEQKTLEKTKKYIQDLPMETTVEVHADSNLDFNSHVEQFFKEKEIKILRQTVLKKGTEIDFTIEIPSPMGRLTYYCKAYNKKRPTEKDISNALVSGQLQKMPVVFLHPGELTKKAQELVKTEPFKMMTFFQLHYGR